MVRTDCAPVTAEEGITGLLGMPGSIVGCTDQLSLEFSQEELKSLDAEGRCVITKHRINSIQDDYLVIFNLYCPRADPERRSGTGRSGRSASRPAGRVGAAA